jgi:hypothetical protein
MTREHFLGELVVGRLGSCFARPSVDGALVPEVMVVIPSFPRHEAYPASGQMQSQHRCRSGPAAHAVAERGGCASE